jgi:hypothetical protein
MVQFAPSKIFKNIRKKKNNVKGTTGLLGACMVNEKTIQRSRSPVADDTGHSSHKHSQIREISNRSKQSKQNRQSALFILSDLSQVTPQKSSFLE